MLKKVLLTTVSVCLATSGAWAANQGTAGVTSQGDLDVSLVINKDVKISNLADIALGTYSGSDMTGTDTACVYMNFAEDYQVTLDNAGAAFELDDGGGNTIVYTVDWSNDGGTTFAAVTYNTAITGQNVNNTTDDDCATAGADNVAVRVGATAANISSEPNGTYTDTLRITVAPDF